MTESDGPSIEQDVDGAFRTAVTQAAALGRMVAQMYEQSASRAAHQDRVAAHDMQQRYDAEKQRALVMLHQADHDGWWNTASTHRVASVVATGQAWKDRDPEIARLNSRVESRIQARWGITPSARIAELSPEQRRTEAQQLAMTLDADSLDNDDPWHDLLAKGIAEEPEQSSQEEPEKPAAHDAERSTDSSQQQREVSQQANTKEEAETTTSRAQHLDQFEAMMRDNGLDDRTIEARMFAERANAKPARDAVTYRPNTSKKPGRRSAPGLGAQRDVERGR